MIKAYIRSEYRYLLFFLVLIMLTPLFTGGITDIINGFIVSHYPCIMLNNIYILIIYKRIHFFRKLKDIVGNVYIIETAEMAAVFIAFCAESLLLCALMEALIYLQLLFDRNIVFVALAALANLYFHYVIILQYY